MAEFYSRFGFDEVKQFPEEFSLELKEVLMAYDPSKHHDSSFESKPDLIVIDGGKGQLGMAVKARDALGLNIPMIGLAKREEDVFVPGKALPLIIPKDSKALLMLRHIRDEAHRFAITFQKDSRKKYLTASALDEVKGVGKGTKQKLLKHFGSVERIKAASLEEISTVVGQKVAENLLAQLK
jgi:excinuclease ABC subunit C